MDSFILNTVTNNEVSADQICALQFSEVKPLSFDYSSFAPVQPQSIENAAQIYLTWFTNMLHVHMKKKNTTCSLFAA